MTQLKDTIRKNLGEGDLDLYVQLVEQLAEEGPHDLAEIAAAAARLASGTTKAVAVAEEPVRPARAASLPSPSPDAGKVRLSMAVGKKDGIRPGDVVGSIANEANIAGRDIGPIDIRDSITYVTIPAEYADQVIEKVGRAKFRGRPLELKIAGPGEGAEPRRPPFQPRPQEWRRPAPAGGDRRPSTSDRRPPRKPFNDRGPRKGPPPRKGR